jgi:hypothetical protein
VLGAIEPFTGDTVIDWSCATVTLRVDAAFSVPTDAEMSVVPTAVLLARPGVEGKFATAGLEEDQVARMLTSRVLPSLNVPITENCVCV